MNNVTYDPPSRIYRFELSDKDALFITQEAIDFARETARREEALISQGGHIGDGSFARAQNNRTLQLAVEDEQDFQRGLIEEGRGKLASREAVECNGETRVVDSVTGGQKGSKLARFSLIPRDFLWALAEHYGRGAQKYEDRNWERGYRWSLSVDALDRHLNAWLIGEDDDEETGSSHLVAVAWHAIALWWWHKRRLGTDDVRGRKQ